ncbi:hypothetical protein JW933_08630 [candidate division FCPU426 bacterium]|nr:hypothetical protein [candidate division FCPU426 bacterium]
MFQPALPTSQERCWRQKIHLPRLLFFCLVFLAVPARARALPFPQMIFGFFELSPFVVAALTSLAVTAGIWFWRLTLKRKDPRRFLGAACLALGLLWLLTASLLSVVWLQKGKEDRLKNLESYLRADLSIHESRVWYYRYLREFPATTLQALHEKILAAPGYKPLLIMSSTKPRYDAGIPLVGPSSAPQVFQHVDWTQLESFLESIPPALRARQDVYWIPSQFLYRAKSPEHHQKLFSLFRSFRSVTFIRYRIGLKALLYIRLPDHTYAKPRFIGLNRRQDWPVRPEPYFQHEQHIVFPNMKKLLSSGAVDKYIRDPSVAILAPYNSAHRSEMIQYEYLAAYLRPRLGYMNWTLFFSDSNFCRQQIRKMQAQKVYAVDYNAPDYLVQVPEISRLLQQQPFVLVALTKHDWIIGGMDILYRTYLDAKARKHSFPYLGASLQMAEYITAWTLAERNRLMHQQLWANTSAAARRLLVQLHRLARFSDLALMLAAAITFFLLSPLLLLGIWCATLRRELEKTITRQMPRKPHLRGLKFFLLKKYQWLPVFEMAEKSATVGVLLAASLLLAPYDSVLPARGFFIADVGQSSMFLNVVFSLLFFMFLRPWILRSSGNTQKNLWLRLSGALLLCLLSFLFLNRWVSFSLGVFTLTFFALRQGCWWLLTPQVRALWQYVFATAALPPRTAVPGFLPDWAKPLAALGGTQTGGKAQVLGWLL